MEVISHEALQSALEACDPRCVLVTPRVLRRVVKRDRAITGIGLDVPHHEGYAIAAEDLVADELGRPLDDLDAMVLLLSQPEPATLERWSLDDARRWAWRRVFHLRADLRFRHLASSGRLTPAAVRERIHRLGQAEMDEIRAVLRKERRLLPPLPDESADGAAYAEFAASYLELREFEPESIGQWFPGLAHRQEEVDALVGRDIGAARLLADTCPDAELQPVANAADEPWVPAPSNVRPPAPITEARHRRLSKRARRRGKKGDVVRIKSLSWKSD